MAAANAGFSEDDNNVASEANRIDSNGKYHVRADRLQLASAAHS